MAEISYRRHRFPPVIIQHAVWLYLRFTLSYRDVEELLAERGLDVSYESVRSWVLKFGPIIARRVRTDFRGRIPSMKVGSSPQLVVSVSGKQIDPAMYAENIKNCGDCSVDGVPLSPIRRVSRHRSELGWQQPAPVLDRRVSVCTTATVNMIRMPATCRGADIPVLITPFAAHAARRTG
jgi:hypothetical protein